MASSCKVLNDFIRLSGPSMHRNACSRGIQSNARAQAAQNFTMPAMSPTMIEGNITSWKVKEGDSFVTGDVLLEIETDKAQMDVEAQDEGQMAKILQQAGAKDVKVGSRIAVTAESDDDLSTLSLPTENSKPTPSPQNDTSSGISPAQSSEAQTEPLSSSRTHVGQPPFTKKSPSSRSSGKPQEQTYPLYPSVAQLFREKNIPASEADKIPTSGPKGRLLKGDVLAYLGRISSSYSSDQSARISRLGHLDLSNVKPEPSKEVSVKPASKPQTPKTAESDSINTEIAVPISLSSVLSVQKRIQATLGVTLPLSTFITRATELANAKLPHSTAKPTNDELFNDILGLNGISSKTSKGAYIPQISALPQQPLKQRLKPPNKFDLYDILAGNVSAKTTEGPRMPPPGIMACSKADESTNIFSVRAVKGEEKRARVFLERVKTILQVEPGRLIF